MRRTYLAIVLAALSACDSGGTDTDSESHFACAADSDCPSDFGPAKCVAQKCEIIVVSTDAGSGSPTGDASGSAQSTGGTTGGGATGGGATGGGATGGGATSGGATSGGTSSGGVTGGQSCDGGCAPPTGNSLTGTWEVIGSRLGGKQQSALVTISPTYLIISAWSGSFNAILRGDTFECTLTQSFRSTKNFGLTRTAGTGDTGIIPLPLFGDWDAHAQNSQGCAIHAASDSASATCTQAGELPDWLRDHLSNAAHLTATRTQTLPSSFGDFGGVWTFTSGYGASCTIRFEETTVSADCQNAHNATGTASFTLDGDTGHGSTSQGIEFTAQRL